MWPGKYDRPANMLKVIIENNPVKAVVPATNRTASIKNGVGRIKILFYAIFYLYIWYRMSRREIKV